MNNGSFAKYTTAYINRPSNSQLVDIKIEIEKLLHRSISYITIDDSLVLFLIQTIN